MLPSDRFYHEETKRFCLSAAACALPPVCAARYCFESVDRKIQFKISAIQYSSAWRWDYTHHRGQSGMFIRYMAPSGNFGMQVIHLETLNIDKIWTFRLVGAVLCHHLGCDLKNMRAEREHQCCWHEMHPENSSGESFRGSKHNEMSAGMFCANRDARWAAELPVMLSSFVLVARPP